MKTSLHKGDSLEPTFQDPSLPPAFLLSSNMRRVLDLREIGRIAKHSTGSQSLIRVYPPITDTVNSQTVNKEAVGCYKDNI